MTLSYLPEYAEVALLALDLAEREAAHLEYTRAILYQLPIDREWVSRLPEREDLAEKIDAFIGRFGRLQDHIGEKLIPRFIQMMGGRPTSLLDALSHAEKMGWLENAETFVGASKLRNLPVHEYMVDAGFLLESLLLAEPATQMLLQIVRRLRKHADSLGLKNERA